MTRRKSKPTWVRLLAKTTLHANGKCIVWTGHVRDSGYATIQHEGRKQLVHRVAYKLVVGPIPDGYEVDHLCFVRHCVNPSHLEAVTPLVNTRRAERGNAQKTRCVHGHEFTPENTRVDPKTGRRMCRQCDSDRQAIYRASDPARRRAAQRDWWDRNRNAYNRARREKRAAA